MDNSHTDGLGGDHHSKDGPRRPPRPARSRGSHSPRRERAPKRQRVSPAVAAVGVLLGVLLGAGGSSLLGASDDAPAEVAEPPASQNSAATRSNDVLTSTLPDEVDEPDLPETTTTAAGPNPSHPIVDAASRDWGPVASALADRIVMPSDCGLPLENPESLPNAGREYRGGVHEGVDFICMEKGRHAVAAMDGRIVQANNTFVDPSNADREAVLDVARSLGRTPPWTLAMMFGRYVVIDHGVILGAGHVVTVYAHFDSLDSALRPGQMVTAGTRLGEIGNRGTETGATGGTRPQSIHLHWELHVDDVFLGAGQDAAATRATYATLFGQT